MARLRSARGAELKVSAFGAVARAGAAAVPETAATAASSEEALFAASPETPPPLLVLLSAIGPPTALPAGWLELELGFCVASVEAADEADEDADAEEAEADVPEDNG